MKDSIIGWLDWLIRQDPSILISLMLAGITILALIKTNKFAKDWFERFWWTITIVCGFLLIVMAFHWGITRHNIKIRLTELNNGEKTVLTSMIKQDGAAHPNKGTAIYYGLANDGIIYKSGDRNEYIETFNIPHWIFKKLQEHPELLEKE